MQLTKFKIIEEHGISRCDEPLSLSMPFQQGALKPDDSLSIQLIQRDLILEHQAKTLSVWPDNSIKWMRLSLNIDVEANEQVDVAILKSTSHDRIEPVRHILTIKSTDENHLFIEHNAQEFEVALKLENELHPFLVSDKTELELVEKGPVFSEYSHKILWRQSSTQKNISSTLSAKVYHANQSIQFDIMIHNPSRSVHAGGLWDLGDPGSTYFEALTLSVEPTPQTIEPSEVSLTFCDSDSSISSSSNLRIYQDSSGGEQWDSRNHIDSYGNSTVSFKGYQVIIDNDVVSCGDRANPILSCKYQENSIQVYQNHFWQNFPSDLRFDKGRINIGLYPKAQLGPYELQGGERKTQSALIKFDRPSSKVSTFNKPLRYLIPSNYYETTNVFPWFCSDAISSSLDQLISIGLDTHKGFFAKREVIDEYGWRNFGEIFADHETLYQESDEPIFITHYNNQYDAIYGFARQYAYTGNSSWFQLMDELACHVADIDIYHTDEDRTEYNKGLFWHTDHYLDAHTATHRTYSKHNDTSSIPGQTGGGPAAEHCYSTGLLYHYYLTGNQDSAEAVSGLADWMYYSHVGTGGLLETILDIKKRDVPKLKQLLRRQAVIPHSYPFTRGTGNLISTLIDAWQLTGDDIWRERIENILSNTLSRHDDISLRHLDNIEKSWSYLVLLLSVTKYLQYKEQINEIDSAYANNRAAFLHYSSWMIKHEKPFLASAEDLEFPNDTWVAQDVRKAMLMFQAAYFDPENSTNYQRKGNEWLDQVCSSLVASDENHFARILIILMQNYGPQHILSDRPPTEQSLSDKNLRELENSPVPSNKIGRLIAKITLRLMKSLVKINIRNEMAWLQKRRS